MLNFDKKPTFGARENGSTASIVDRVFTWPEPSERTGSEVRNPEAATW